MCQEMQQCTKKGSEEETWLLVENNVNNAGFKMFFFLNTFLRGTKCIQPGC